MELLKTIRRKSFLSESVYVTLNIALAVAVLVIVRTVASPVPALLLVLLSKWRVFAVRPRYWIANIQANLVDVIVSMSMVVLMYSVGSLPASLGLQIALTVLYVLWLVLLKPRSSRSAVVAQAATALIIGTTVLFISSYAWPIELVVIGLALVGYITARHVLTQFEEDHLQFLSLVWAFVMAQLGWILSHWVVAYPIPGIDLSVPQAAIIVAALAFVVYRVYVSYRTHGYARAADVSLPILFSISVALVLIVFFSPAATL